MSDRPANLLVCASCEWMFYFSVECDTQCPKCGFASYGAYRTYGRVAYKYAMTQQPWKKKQVAALLGELDKIADDAHNRNLIELEFDKTDALL